MTPQDTVSHRKLVNKQVRRDEPSKIPSKCPGIAVYDNKWHGGDGYSGGGGRCYEGNDKCPTNYNGGTNGGDGHGSSGDDICSPKKQTVLDKKSFEN